LSGTGINWRGVAFWIILLMLLACITFYVFDLFHFKSSIAAFTSAIGIPKLSSINLSGITDFVAKNGAVIGIVGGLGTTALTYFIKNYQANKLLDKTIADTQTRISQQESVANAKIVALEQKLSSYEGDTTADQLQTKLSSITGINQNLEDKLKAVLAQNEQLQKLPSQMANELWAKSGGQILDVNGVLYKVIEKEIVNVK
jgi:type II secretory pathway pseudopilin PulG